MLWSGFCSAIEAVIEHGMFFDCFGGKQALRNGTRGLSGKPPVEKDQSKYPNVKITKDTKLLVSLTAGICTTEAQALEFMKLVEKVCQSHGIDMANVVFTLAHNATDGVFGDGLETLLCRAGFKVLPVRNLIQTWKDAQQQADDLGIQLSFLHIAHSQGGAITQVALKASNRAIKENMSVLTFGTASVILKSETGVAYAKNYVHKTDGVTQCMDPLGLIQGWQTNEVEFVGSFISIPFANHGFMSPDYQSALSRGVGQVIERSLR